MRVSQFARNYGVKSIDVIRILNVVAPDLNVKSASSRLEINRDNRIFFDTVAVRAAFRDLEAIG